jgi:hypothetical protein
VLIALAGMGIIIFKAVQKPTNPQKISASENKEITINNADNKIVYSGPWEKIVDNASQARNKDFHMVPKPRLDFAKNNYGATAQFSFTGSQVTIGSLGGTTRGKMDIYIDGKLVDTWSQNRNNTAPIIWVSDDLPCQQHTLKMSQSTSPLLLPPASRPTFHILLDYISYQSCSAGNTPPSSTSDKCQGNSNAPAKCFSCNKDQPNDEVNIYDFACFSKWYGSNVGIR